jgi:uncharacterized protein
MLLDTSGLLCLLHRAEPQHDEAVAFYQQAMSRLIHSYVLAELIPLAQVRGLSRQRTLIFSQRTIKDQAIEMVWVDEPLHQRALDLLQARSDKTYSLCDAVSFVLMRERSVLEALTTDRHFEQEGFIRLLNS